VVTEDKLNKADNMRRRAYGMLYYFLATVSTCFLAALVVCFDCFFVHCVSDCSIWWACLCITCACCKKKFRGWSASCPDPLQVSVLNV